MEKKNVAIVVLIIALVASGVGNIILILPFLQPYVPIRTLIRGTGAGPHTLDPTNSWDSASNDVLDQVFEGLFTYNLSDPELPRYNLLAESYFWQDTSTLQVKLVEDVVFHDDYPLNSTSAKWSFDRLNYMCNASNELNRVAPFNETNEGAIGEPASLYFLPNGTHIINEVEAVGEYNITFHLSAPFAPFLDLLCYESSKLMSPLSTPATRFVELYEVPVGTGPFKFVSFTANVEVRFVRNDNYWRQLAWMEELIFALIPSTTTRSNAMLSGQIDYVSGYSPSLIGTYRADADIHVEDFTDNTGKPGLSYYYLGMNNVLINETMREAISYAINYTYIIKNIGNDLVFRANSPISPGYGAAYNASVEAANYNVTKARQVMIDAGITTLGVNDDSGWLSAEFLAVNYSYNTDNQIRADIGTAATQWLDQIGVRVIDDGITWSAFLNKLYVFPNLLGIYWVGWGPDYLDPFNMLDPLFNPLSSADSAQVDDAWLNSQMATALNTPDDTARNNIYKLVQWYLAEKLRPHAFGYHPKITTVHAANLRGVPYNAMGNFEAYPIYRV
ncbi:MAG: ABC transporter substrate-binding protein [Promethearchaeota archaeon]|nr:MAG: ABC transporter substrate-binding protein [Candidatus Lokiarchaeota archaeon]